LKFFAQREETSEGRTGNERLQGLSMILGEREQNKRKIVKNEYDGQNLNTRPTFARKLWRAMASQGQKRLQQTIGLKTAGHADKEWNMEKKSKKQRDSNKARHSKIGGRRVLGRDWCKDLKNQFQHCS